MQKQCYTSEGFVTLTWLWIRDEEYVTISYFKALQWVDVLCSYKFGRKVVVFVPEEIVRDLLHIASESHRKKAGECSHMGWEKRINTRYSGRTLDFCNIMTVGLFLYQSVSDILPAGYTLPTRVKLNRVSSTTFGSWFSEKYFSICLMD